MAKASKQEAEYVPHAKRDHCDTCNHWRNGTCTVVAGAINPDGTSKFFEPMKGKAKK